MKTSMDNEEKLRERDEAARKSLHNQRMQLAAERAKNQKLETDLENSNNQVKKLQRELKDVTTRYE